MKTEKGRQALLGSPVLEPTVTSCGKYYLQSFGEQDLFLGQTLENIEALFLRASKQPSPTMEVKDKY